MTMSDVFRVSMVVGEERCAELEGSGLGQEFTVGRPLQVPAVVLARAAGVPVEELPDMKFVLSDGGWRPAGAAASC